MASLNRLVRIALTAATGILLSATTACASAKASQRHVTLSASWATEYQSLSALKHNADVAVQGVFERTIRVTKDEDRLPYTDFGFTVRSVLLGPESG
jgi:hypothetical protein